MESIEQNIKSEILESYRNALEKAEQNLGLDAHLIKLKTENIDAAKINHEIAEMFKYGQLTVKKILDIENLESKTKELYQIATLSEISSEIPFIGNNKIGLYKNIQDKKDTKTTRANAHTILDDLYNAFYFGVMRGKNVPGDIPKPLSECNQFKREVYIIKSQKKYT